MSAIVIVILALSLIVSEVSNRNTRRQLKDSMALTERNLSTIKTWEDLHAKNMETIKIYERITEDCK